jgi:phosphoglycolate phosphatase
LAGLFMALANGLIGFLDRVGLDERTYKLGERLRQWRGKAPASKFWLAPERGELLSKLASAYRLGIVTSRSKAEVERFLGSAQLDSVMSVVVTRDSARRMKPHRQPVDIAAAELEVEVERCAMVGDTRVDMRAARSAGAIAVGVLSGFGSRRRLRHADLLLDDVTQLVGWLLRADADEHNGDHASAEES